MRKSRRENEWRDLLAHSFSGAKTSPASFSDVVRNGATGSRVVRAIIILQDVAVARVDQSLLR